MAIEEQISSRLAYIGQQAAGEAARLTVRVSGRLAAQLAGAGGWSVRKTVDALRDRIDSGRMSEGRLQRVAGGDIHEIELDPESLRAVGRSLKQAGLDFAIEHDGDEHYLHFQGRDIDHVQHAVARAFRSIGLELDPDSFAPARSAGDSGQAARQAREQASRNMPTHSKRKGPFTMVFNTVEWDRNANIITSNLKQMQIPFTQDSGPGNDQQSFTFDASYAPAVRSFIDAYSDKVDHFSTDRVENYDQLCDPSTAPAETEHHGPAETETPAMDDGDRPAPAGREKARPAGTPRKAHTEGRKNTPPAAETAKTAKTAETASPAKTVSKGKDGMTARPDKAAPAQAAKKDRNEFLTMLNKRTEHKLAESKEAPKRSIKHGKGR